MISKTLSMTFLLAWGVWPLVAQAEPRGGPPQEAIDSCAGVTLGQACRFDGRRGEISGTCREVPEGDIACVPKDRRGRRGPPPEAFAACEGLSEGAACSVDTPQGALSGRCRTPRHKSPEGAGLVCAPAGGPPS